MILRRFIQIRILGFASLLGAFLVGDAVSATSHLSSSASSSLVVSIKPERESFETYHLLQEGNRRFSAGKNLHPHSKPQRRSQLAHEQRPKAIVVTCSDSRVPPELIFDQGLGDIFTVRTAGHALGSASIASIEYAINQLHSNLIIVMGHESCGAVKEALHPPRSRADFATDAEFQSAVHLEKLLSKIRPNISSYVGKPVESTLRGPVRANVEGTVATLLARSPVVFDAVTTHQVMIVQAIYHLSGGHVEFWEVKPNLLVRKKAIN